MTGDNPRQICPRRPPSSRRTSRQSWTGVPVPSSWASIEPVFGVSSPVGRQQRPRGRQQRPWWSRFPAWTPQPSPAPAPPLPMTPALPEGCPDIGSVLDSGFRGGLGPSVSGMTVTGQMGWEPAGSSQNPRPTEARETSPPAPSRCFSRWGCFCLSRAPSPQGSVTRVPTPASRATPGKGGMPSVGSLPVADWGVLCPVFISH